MNADTQPPQPHVLMCSSHPDNGSKKGNNMTLNLNHIFCGPTITILGEERLVMIFRVNSTMMYGKFYKTSFCLLWEI